MDCKQLLHVLYTVLYRCTALHCTPCTAELEIKHGLLQLADGLHFLHAEGGMVHRAISPASILITQTGASGGRWRRAVGKECRAACTAGAGGLVG